MLNRSSLFFVVRVLLVGVLVSSLFLFSPAGEVNAAPAGEASGAAGAQDPAGMGGADYPKQGIHTGVFNDGQAAPWDLSLIDHFKYFGAPERGIGYRPEQPIPFSHVTHVQQNQMECQYCHWSVTKSGYAAIPEVETCMGCHKYVLGRTEEQKSAISKIQEHWKEGTPIPWEKVHVMPNYMKFNHKRHVKAGVSCHSCHGQVPEMDVVERVTSMKMGWCIECHRDQGTSIDCATCHY
ncbi:MAG: cytochrome c3 family protein [Bdellovibrionales bacterium]|nr:cytochrome c3 family protein [Bdellovibrionales bacterium]